MIEPSIRLTAALPVEAALWSTGLHIVGVVDGATQYGLLHDSSL